MNDITSGSDGNCGNVLCNGATGWDGPTGVGTPDGVEAFKGLPEGTISGQVTAADTGKPVSGARVTVSPGGEGAVTDGDGNYRLSGLPVGSYQVTAGGVFAYEPQTATVAVSANQAVTQNFALTPATVKTVSGTITDGSGHGWPLYAAVTADDGAGHAATVFTDPATGRYSLPLLPNTSYLLHVSAAYPGYLTLDKTIAVGDADLTVNAALHVDALMCDAPGYRATGSGLTESFNTGKKPTGWRASMTDHNLPGYTETGWAFNNPGHRKNHTGGSAGFAIVDSDHAGNLHYQDATLTSPVVDLRRASTPVLTFATDLEPAVNSIANVDVSVNGGKTWTNVWTKKSFPGYQGPAVAGVALPHAAGKAAVQVRFRYIGSWSQYWEIDNVYLGQRTCAPAAGGLVVGQVSDPTGAGIPGATVSSAADPTEKTVTVATPTDPNLGDGLYWLFSSRTGAQGFIASAPGSKSSTRSATVAANRVSSLNFTLRPGVDSSVTTVFAPAMIYGNAAHVTVTVRGGAATATGSVKLTGAGRTRTRSLAGGKATFTLPKKLGVGSHVETASYAGNSKLKPSTGHATLNVNKRRADVPTLEVTSTPTRTTTGRAAIAVPHRAGLATPTGKVTVTLKLGKTTKSVTAVLTSGKATVTLPKLPTEGTWSAAATYRGNGTYLSRTSSTVLIKVL